jgi:hypothetical protein
VGDQDFSVFAILGILRWISWLRWYSSLFSIYNLPSDLLIVEHTLNGRIHLLDVDVLAILTESNPKPMRRRIDWLGHTTHGIKLTRTVDGRGLLSRGASGDSIAWGLDNSGLIQQRAIVPFEQTCLSVTLIAGTSLYIFTHRNKVNIVWRYINMQLNYSGRDRPLRKGFIPSASMRLGISCAFSSFHERQMTESSGDFLQLQMPMNHLLGRLTLPKVLGLMKRLRMNYPSSWSVEGRFLPRTMFILSPQLIPWDGTRQSIATPSTFTRARCL